MTALFYVEIRFFENKAIASLYQLHVLRKILAQLLTKSPQIPLREFGGRELDKRKKLATNADIAESCLF